MIRHYNAYPYCCCEPARKNRTQNRKFPGLLLIWLKRLCGNGERVEQWSWPCNLTGLRRMTVSWNAYNKAVLLIGFAVLFVPILTKAQSAFGQKSIAKSVLQTSVPAGAGTIKAPFATERIMHYLPVGKSFVLNSGTRRFNRALYGTNTAFRVEGGDQPEFSFYLPGMGGNIRFLLQVNATEKAQLNAQEPVGVKPVAIWLTAADKIETIFDAGHLRYIIHDQLLGKGSLQLDLYALADREGAVFAISGESLPKGCSIGIIYGGVSAEKFSRSGDIGADPESSFDFKVKNCQANRYQINGNQFILQYGREANSTATSVIKPATHLISGQFPAGAQLTVMPADVIGPVEDRQIRTKKTVSSGLLNTLRLNSNRRKDLEKKNTKVQRVTTEVSHPALLANFALSSGQTKYAVWEFTPLKDGKIQTQDPVWTKSMGRRVATKNKSNGAASYEAAKSAAESLGNRIRISTPDPYINCLGGVLSAAADAIWEAPTYLHGAVAWRMRLPAWRGPYAADALGWHDRASEHFSSYGLSQVKSPEKGPVLFDSSRNHARQLEKMGTAMFSAGYIARNPNGDIRPHHYDMNLVYIDQLLAHFNYTGDTAFLRKMWPVIALSLKWEDRNFDADSDGLFDAYACIWASDALGYNGGAVTHSTAYNYRANRLAAVLAAKLGLDPKPYQAKATQIRAAVNKELWMPGAGVYAEYKDRFGQQNLHPSPGLWTLYHSIESGLPDPFQAYQVLDYADRFIPHIPVRATGLKDTSLWLLSTTNWQPYTWSVNNVALAENLNMALGYWLGGAKERGFQLWKSALTASLFLGASPGGFEQLSYYDARRGELYRDFADPIGVAARSLMEGLFGFRPDAIKDTLMIAPGFPSSWDSASISTPDIDFAYFKKGKTSQYHIRPHYPRKMALRLQLPALSAGVKTVSVNGQATDFYFQSAIGGPELIVNLPIMMDYKIVIRWLDKDLPTLKRTGERLEKLDLDMRYANKANVETDRDKALEATYDLQVGRILSVRDPQQLLKGFNIAEDGHKITLRKPVGRNGGLCFIQLETEDGLYNWWEALSFNPEPQFKEADDDAEKTFNVSKARLSDWFKEPIKTHQPIRMAASFNDDVTHIFRKQYLNPRASTVSLQLPLQGIGNWCYPGVQPVIDDQGLRRLAANKGLISMGDSLAFYSPSAPKQHNIAFVSLWDCYPDSIKIPVQGEAAGIAFLMTGSTNPMQSQMENAQLVIEYEDQSRQVISLRNPETWWPIEQDYYRDNYAFALKQSPPTRVHLKTGKIYPGFAPDSTYTSLKGFSDRVIDGGAAAVYQFRIDPHKKLRAVTVKATATDVVIGLMGICLINPKDNSAKESTKIGSGIINKNRN